jgi:hypothetical protein
MITVDGLLNAFNITRDELMLVSSYLKLLSRFEQSGPRSGSFVFFRLCLHSGTTFSGMCMSLP